MYCRVPGRCITVVRCSGSAVTVVGCNTVRVVTGVYDGPADVMGAGVLGFPKPTLPGNRLRDGKWGERVGTSRMKLFPAHEAQALQLAQRVLVIHSKMCLARHNRGIKVDR